MTTCLTGRSAHTMSLNWGQMALPTVSPSIRQITSSNAILMANGVGIGNDFPPEEVAVDGFRLKKLVASYSASNHMLCKPMLRSDKGNQPQSVRAYAPQMLLDHRISRL